MPAPDGSEDIQKNPRPRPPVRPPAQPPRPGGEGIQPGQSRRRPRDDDDDDDRPRRRDDRRDRDDRRRDEPDDGVSTIIPYKNGLALAGYYMGVFSLIPCLGMILGPMACLFGLMGLLAVKKNPQAKGTAHAVTAMVLGGIAVFYHVVGIAIIVITLPR